VIAPKFKDREGGYTRVYKLGWRQGDGAPLSLVELVTYASPEEKKKSTIKKAREVLEKVTPKKKEKGEKKEKEKGKEKKEKKVKKEGKEALKGKKEKPKKKSEPKGK
jgi:large subunit ribosomal protein L17